MFFGGILLWTSFVCVCSAKDVSYDPTWASLDSRPLPGWYDNAKFGIFIHWGVFSVPANEEWFWEKWQTNPFSQAAKYMRDNYPPKFTYQDFGPQFKAELFNADQWADILKSSGAKYMVLTSKHHEGFTLWPSDVSFGWNAMAIGPKRDLVKELATAVRANTDIKFGLYHSLYEWYNPLFLRDKANNFTSQYFVQTKTIPELYEIVLNYKPQVIWSDGSWDAHSDYWTSKEFLQWLYNESPVKDSVVTNDRWGRDTLCKHGGYYTCSDRYNPGKVMKHKWENAFTLDRVSWGLDRQSPLSNYLTDIEVITEIISTVACNGNALMNIGPGADGTILPIFQMRLKYIGYWLSINGDAVFGTRPWLYQNETDIWYTAKKSTNSKATTTTVFATLLKWPKSQVLTFNHTLATANTKIRMLGVEKPISFESVEPMGIRVSLKGISIADLPATTAWVLEFTGLHESQQRYHEFFEE